MASDTYAITSRNIKALGPIPSAFSLTGYTWLSHGMSRCVQFGLISKSSLEGYGSLSTV